MERVRRGETRSKVHVFSEALIAGVALVSLLDSPNHSEFAFASPSGRPADGTVLGVMLRLGALGRVGEKLAVLLVHFAPVFFSARLPAVLDHLAPWTKPQTVLVIWLVPAMHCAIGAERHHYY